jgi:hypothetical protein
MSKHPKPGGGKPHPQPNQNRTRDNKTEISGDIFVRGEIETHLPPSEVQKLATAEEKHDTRENKRYLVELITLLVVIIYGALTGWQAWETRQAVKAASEANRLNEELVRGRIQVIVRLKNIPEVGKTLLVPVEITNRGHSIAVEGLTTGRGRLYKIPFADMSGMADPNPATFISPGDSEDTAIQDGEPITQQFLDGLPTVMETTNPSGMKRGESAYFFGKLIYKTLGKTYRVEFCYSLAKADQSVKGFGSSVENDAIVLVACPTWNSTE